MLRIRYSKTHRFQLMLFVLALLVLPFTLTSCQQQDAKADSQEEIASSTPSVDTTETTPTPEDTPSPETTPTPEISLTPTPVPVPSAPQTAPPAVLSNQSLLQSSINQNSSQVPIQNPIRSGTSISSSSNTRKAPPLEEEDAEEIEAAEFNPNKPASVIITVPERKPNGQYWDGLPQGGQGVLTQLGHAAGFFTYDSPPDIKLYAVTPEEEVIDFGRFVQDRFEAEFEVSRLPETFALIAIDLDGVGFRGPFHDFIGAAIFAKNKKDVDDIKKQKLFESMLRLLGKVGVQRNAHPFEFNVSGQIPPKIRVIGIYDCVAKPCRLSRTDSVVIQFSNDTN